MIFKSIQFISKNVINRGQEYFNLSRDIFREGYRVYQERTGKADVAVESEDSSPKEPLRKNMEKNFTVQNNMDQAELARQTSLKSRQHVDHDLKEGWNSNMQQRNFNNHQGN